MQGSTKFLLGIVIVIVLLVIITFGVVMLRPEPAYLDNNTPDGAAHNYLLAIQQGDYDRAYTYIPDAHRYPKDAEAMADTIDDESYRFDTDSDFSLAVESVVMRGQEKAVVTINKTKFYNSGLMNSGQSTHTFTLDMILEDGQWKVNDGESYWSNCWGVSQDQRCR